MTDERVELDVEQEHEGRMRAADRAAITEDRLAPGEPWWTGGEVTRDADDVAYDREYAEYLAAHPGYRPEWQQLDPSNPEVAEFLRQHATRMQGLVMRPDPEDPDAR